MFINIPQNVQFIISTFYKNKYEVDYSGISFGGENLYITGTCTFEHNASFADKENAEGMFDVTVNIGVSNCGKGEDGKLEFNKGFYKDSNRLETDARNCALRSMRSMVPSSANGRS